jgi:hypothetical protein
MSRITQSSDFATKVRKSNARGMKTYGKAEWNFKNNQFAQTRQMFSEYTGVSSPISYEDWVQQSEDMKAAILFVNFYEQITFAWFKTANEHLYEEYGVDEAVSICSKLCGASFKRIQSNTNTKSVMTPDTFKPSYIYRVMKNAFDCLTYTKNITKFDYIPDCEYAPKNRIDNRSQYFTDASGVEQDIFDITGEDYDPLEVIESERLKSLIEEAEDCEETQYIMDRLLRYDERMNEAKDLDTLNKVKEARAKFVERNLEAISALQEKFIDFCPA